MFATIIVILIRGYLNPESQTSVKLSARTSTLYPKAIYIIVGDFYHTNMEVDSKEMKRGPAWGEVSIYCSF